MNICRVPFSFPVFIICTLVRLLVYLIMQEVLVETDI